MFGAFSLSAATQRRPVFRLRHGDGGAAGTPVGTTGALSLTGAASARPARHFGRRRASRLELWFRGSGIPATAIRRTQANPSFAPPPASRYALRRQTR